MRTINLIWFDNFDGLLVRIYIKTMSNLQHQEDALPWWFGMDKGAFGSVYYTNNVVIYDIVEEISQPGKLVLERIPTLRYYFDILSNGNFWWLKRIGQRARNWGVYVSWKYLLQKMGVSYGVVGFSLHCRLGDLQWAENNRGNIAVMGPIMLVGSASFKRYEQYIIVSVEFPFIWHGNLPRMCIVCTKVFDAPKWILRIKNFAVLEKIVLRQSWGKQFRFWELLNVKVINTFKLDLAPNIFYFILQTIMWEWFDSCCMDSKNEQFDQPISFSFHSFIALLLYTLSFWQYYNFWPFLIDD